MAQFKQFKISVAIASLALAFGSGGAAAQEPVRKLSVALSGGQLTIFAPFLVAVGTKAFEKRGIVFDLQSFGSGTTSFAAFAGGSTDFAVVGSSQVLTAAGSGRDVLSIFNMYHGGAVVFVGARKNQDSRGTNLKKYDGSTWAYTAEGSVSQVFMARAAQAAGLDWNKQNRLAVGTVDAFIPTLQQGRADMVTMDMKAAAQAIKLGIGYSVLNTNDAAVVEPILGRQLGLPLVTTRAFAVKNPKLIQDIADAMREGLLAVQKNVNDPAAILKMMPASYQEANRSDFPIQWDLAKPAFAHTDGTFSERAISDTVAFARATGVLKVAEGAQFDPNKYFDSTWARQAITNVANRPAR